MTSSISTRTPVRSWVMRPAPTPMRGLGTATARPGRPARASRGSRLILMATVSPSLLPVVRIAHRQPGRDARERRQLLDHACVGPGAHVHPLERVRADHLDAPLAGQELLESGNQGAPAG